MVHDSTSVRRCSRRKKILVAIEGFVVISGLLGVLGGWMSHRDGRETDPAISTLSFGQEVFLYDYDDSVVSFQTDEQGQPSFTRHDSVGTKVTVVDDMDTWKLGRDRPLRIRFSDNPETFWVIRENLRPKP